MVPRRTLMGLVAVWAAALCLPAAAQTRVTNDVLALYVFEEGSGDTVHDVSGVGSPLDLTIADPASVTWLPGGGLSVDAETLIGSAEVATKIITGCMANNAISVEIWAKPADAQQGGPAPVVTLSEGASERNFALGQEESRYCFRLRTTVTGDEGGSPGFLSGYGDASPSRTQVVVTRDPSGHAQFYVNGILTVTGSVDGAFSNWDPSFRLGLANEILASRPWLGELHLVAIYRRALTSSEVLQNYGAGHDPGDETPPSIRVEPQDVTVTEPDPATFLVVGGGSAPLSYAWRRDGFVIPGATMPQYVLNPTDVAADDGAQFDVIVSNAYGTVTSRVATLTVQEYVPEPARIETEPQDVTVTEPDPATFTVVAAGDAPLSYAWRRNGTVIAGATAPSYVLDPTDAAVDDGAQFDVIVSNAYGTVTSRVATLTVHVYVPEMPRIVGQPQDVTVFEPDPALFTVSVLGESPLSYQWRRNGSAISGANGSSYLLNPTDAAEDDGAQFEVVVSNPYGTVTSRTATLTVNVYVPEPARIDLEPQNVTVTEPAEAIFTVVAGGDAPLTYRWRRNGATISGATGAAYVLDPTDAASDDGSQFDVIVSNPYGTVTSRTATLTVHAYVPAPARIDLEPQDVTVMEPIEAVFTVVAGGDAPLTYRWRRNGVTIPGATGAAYVLNPTDAASDDGAQFDVIVSNPYGTVTSRTATLTVNGIPPQPARIDVQPQDTIVIAPNAAVFTVVAGGDAPLTYRWRRNGATISGATGAAYVLNPTDVAQDNGARFDVVVSNPYGTVTSRQALLSVYATMPVPARIDMQPQDVTVTEPAPATFTVLAKGDAPLSYQWRRNGTNIQGAAASSYTLDPTEWPRDDGAGFAVVVRNPTGCVTSRWAALTVLRMPRAPAILEQPEDITVPEPEPAPFAVSAEGDLPLAYQWRRNGTPIPGATAPTYEIATTSGEDDGALFDVVVSNHVGTVTSGPATLTVTGEAAIEGTLFYAGGRTGRILVAAFPCSAEGVSPAHCAELSAPGTYCIDNLYSGAFYVAAILVTTPPFGLEDARVTDPWGIHGSPTNPFPVVLDGVQGADGVDLEIVDGGVPWPNPFLTYTAPYDFGGDGCSDAAVFWPAGGTWYVRHAEGASDSFKWGWKGTTPLTGDFDGDGLSDAVVIWPATGTWYVRYTGGGSDSFQWGWKGTTPLTGDFDGDGLSDAVVIWPASGTWYVRYTGGGSDSFKWGWKGTTPLTGDFDGDGLSDAVVIWPATGTWYVRHTGGGSDSFQWGWKGTTPLTGDFDGDGLSDAVVIWPATGTWYVRHTGGGSDSFKWGWKGTTALSEDFDGDGLSDAVVIWFATGTWYVRYTGGGSDSFKWGWKGTLPASVSY